MEHFAELVVDGRRILLRRAVAGDVVEVVRLLAADQLGATRESAEDPAPYLEAFAAMDRDPAHLLLVADDGGRPVGTLQLSFIPGLARRGALRAQIEAVRVSAELRGSGVGAWMVGWAVAEAERRGCVLVQLTTDRRRGDAHRFYERLGFVASHEGMKLAF